MKYLLLFHTLYLQGLTHYTNIFQDDFHWSFTMNSCLCCSRVFLSKHPRFTCPVLLCSLALPIDESAGVKTKIFVSKVSSALFFLLISHDWFPWELRWTFLCYAFHSESLDCIRSAHGSYYKLIRTSWEVNKRSMTNCVMASFWRAQNPHIHTNTHRGWLENKTDCSSWDPKTHYLCSHVRKIPFVSSPITAGQKLCAVSWKTLPKKSTLKWCSRLHLSSFCLAGNLLVLIIPAAISRAKQPCCWGLCPGLHPP